jgi:GT2 family glycosyltransferase
LSTNVILSILIVSYNTKDLLRKCLRSIYSQINNDKFEIIVIDNNSSDGSVKMVEKEFPVVRVISNDKNLGFSKANNLGFKQSTGEYALLLNSDILLMNKFIEQMLNDLREHSTVGVVGCRLWREDMSEQSMTNYAFSVGTELLRLLKVKKLFKTPASREFISKYLGKYLGKGVRSYVSSPSGTRKAQRVDYVSGACMLVRKEAIAAVGYFDENFFMYYEDIDLCLRVKKIGWEIILSPHIGAIHYVGQSSIGEPEKINSEYIKSMLYYHDKHHTRVELLFVQIIAGICLITQTIVLWFRQLIDKNLRREGFKKAIQANLSCIKTIFSYAGK